jgi:hypothetical protein
MQQLNTNCGQQQDDFEFLKKLQRRPCVVEDVEGSKMKEEEEMEEQVDEVSPCSHVEGEVGGGLLMYIILPHLPLPLAHATPSKSFCF